jgi:3-methyladenine DNA glycosylase AlkD
MTKKYSDAHAHLEALSDPRRAQSLMRYFKTGPGEYGEGDLFIGITVPVLRKASLQFADLGYQDLTKLIKSKIHEDRLFALMILGRRFGRSDPAEQEKIFKFYMRHIKQINNWDLVDGSCEQIVGAYLSNRNRDLLDKLAVSRNLWQRRISIISTFHFIKRGDFQDTLRISGLLLGDSHDLIHKAVGWMLREVCNRNEETGEKFLRAHLRKLPRTTLRYAIERFPAKKRRSYLDGTILIRKSR